MRRRKSLAVGLLACLLMATGCDTTAGRPPLDVVHQAGEKLLQAKSYAFVATLTGQSESDYLLPIVRSNGSYQNSPQVIHVKGEIDVDTTRKQMEYWQEAGAVYAWEQEKWIRLADPSGLPDLAAFMPPQVSFALRQGAVSAEALRTERLPEGMATVYNVKLDSSKVGPLGPAALGADSAGGGAAPRGDSLAYDVWVLQKNGLPAQLQLHVVHHGSEMQAGLEFVYTIRLTQMNGLPKQAVPATVKGSA